jgi:hypothetical protein
MTEKLLDGVLNDQIGKPQGQTKAALNHNIIDRLKIRRGISVSNRKLTTIIFQNVVVSSMFKFTDILEECTGAIMKVTE